MYWDKFSKTRNSWQRAVRGRGLNYSRASRKKRA